MDTLFVYGPIHTQTSSLRVQRENPIAYPRGVSIRVMREKVGSLSRIPDNQVTDVLSLLPDLFDGTATGEELINLAASVGAQTDAYLGNYEDIAYPILFQLDQPAIFNGHTVPTRQLLQATQTYPMDILGKVAVGIQKDEVRRYKTRFKNLSDYNDPYQLLQALRDDLAQTYGSLETNGQEIAEQTLRVWSEPYRDPYFNRNLVPARGRVSYLLYLTAVYQDIINSAQPHQPDSLSQD